jgi:WXXGXW repeat (2 copies)
MSSRVSIHALLFSLILVVLTRGASGQMAVGISVSFGPPALPVYEQPICPGDNFMWVPGYWAYDDDDGYYWVPGTWVEAPEAGFLWTPGYWAWSNGLYLWNAGYWGPQVGFYGGINYGFGYFGTGFGGGEWRGGSFFYNTAVVRVNNTTVTNVYVNKTVIVNNNSHVAFNGGQGGVEARPTAQQEQYSRESHTPAVAAQTQHEQAARGNPQLRASANQGKPPVAATAKPADFKSGAIPSRAAGGAYKAPPPNAARGNEARPGNEASAGSDGHPGNTAPAANPSSHAGDLQPHKFTPPNTGNPATDKKYQEQQDKLAAKQAQDHQKLQQQQEKDHQHAAQANYNDAQKQQMEQRHTQQTQKVEQQHAAQQQKMEQQQARPQSKPPAEKPH